MNSDGFVSARFLQSLLEACLPSGIDAAQLEQHTGIAFPGPEDDEAEVTVSEYCTLLEAASVLCDDEFIGLHMGEAIKPGHYGVLGYACMSSENLGEALQRALRYQMLVGDICNLSLCTGNLSTGTGCGILIFEFPHHTTPPRLLAEENLAGIVSFARWISGTGYAHAPLQVDFQHEAPEDLSEYQRIFNCEIRFSCPETCLYFSEDYLGFTLPQADKTMLSMVEPCAEELLLSLTSSNAFADQVTSVLAGLLKNGEPGLNQLATSMEMSVRTLQRQLQEEGMSYQQLLEHVRHKLAVIYIAQPQLSLTGIACLLGFAEQSSFQRAFKRWTGETPGRYRKHRITSA